MTENKVQETKSQIVTPWDVQGEVVDGESKGIDYEKVVQQFGATLISDELLERWEKVTGKKAHHLLKRGVFFSHRDVEMILDRHEKGLPFYLYTGRGPSSESMHLGHMVPFLFCKYLQDTFDVPLVIQLTDDEKFLWKDITLEQAHYYSFENAKDIIAVGFNPEKTFMFTNIDYLGYMYDTILRDIPCLIPCAIDQDPYFRVTRDVAPRLKFQKPALLHSKFFPSLQGASSKMSASDTNTAIFMTDTANEIKNKVNRHAFSGGQVTVEEHRKLGGNPDVDVSFQYLKYFLESQEEIDRLYDGYRKGEILTSELKARCISYFQEFVGDFQKRRSEITDELVKKFMQLPRFEPVDVLKEDNIKPNKKNKSKAAVDSNYIKSLSTPNYEGESMSSAMEKVKI